MIDIFLWFKF